MPKRVVARPFDDLPEDVQEVYRLTKINPNEVVQIHVGGKTYEINNHGKVSVHDDPPPEGLRTPSPCSLVESTAYWMPAFKKSTSRQSKLSGAKQAPLAPSRLSVFSASFQVNAQSQSTPSLKLDNKCLCLQTRDYQLTLHLDKHPERLEMTSHHDIAWEGQILTVLDFLRKLKQVGLAKKTLGYAIRHIENLDTKKPVCKSTKP